LKAKLITQKYFKAENRRRRRRRTKTDNGVILIATILDEIRVKILLHSYEKLVSHCTEELLYLSEDLSVDFVLMLG
jgi:hypothetical protein